MVRAAISDPQTAVRLVKLGLVLKLATLLRQFAQGSPPPLPPRRGSGEPKPNPPPAYAELVSADAAADGDDDTPRGGEEKAEAKKVSLVCYHVILHCVCACRLSLVPVPVCVSVILVLLRCRRLPYVLFAHGGPVSSTPHDWRM